MSNILKAFNNHLLEFVDDLISVFPDDIDLKAMQVFLCNYKKINPKSIIGLWKYYVSDKYRNEINKGDLTFFLNKDYSEDIIDVNWDTVENISVIVEKIRMYVKKLNDDNRQKALKYLQNLIKLSDLYD